MEKEAEWAMGKAGGGLTQLPILNNIQVQALRHNSVCLIISCVICAPLIKHELVEPLPNFDITKLPHTKLTELGKAYLKYVDSKWCLI